MYIYILWLFNNIFNHLSLCDATWDVVKCLHNHTTMLCIPSKCWTMLEMSYHNSLKNLRFCRPHLSFSNLFIIHFASVTQRVAGGSLWDVFVTRACHRLSEYFKSSLFLWAPFRGNFIAFDALPYEYWGWKFHVEHNISKKYGHFG
jgi:hypothetical protein